MKWNNEKTTNDEDEVTFLPYRQLMKDEEELIVVHNTFTADWEMDAYFDLAREHGYAVHTIIVENRHGSKNVHDVPQDVVKAQIERFSVTL